VFKTRRNRKNQEKNLRLRGQAKKEGKLFKFSSSDRNMMVREGRTQDTGRKGKNSRGKKENRNFLSIGRKKVKWGSDPWISSGKIRKGGRGRGA